MTASSSASELREMISKAIDDHILTREEFDQILYIASEDGHIDSQEQALLEQLHEMIHNKTVKVVGSK